MTFADLQKALDVFGIGERASLKEIKARHRLLVKRCHPDAGKMPDQTAIREVNAAYRILLDYVDAYRFSFDENEFYEQNPEERLRQQFMNTPLWGSK
jgi:curved DNA-binding protein CbpA